jgi:hypothetical protein
MLFIEVGFGLVQAVFFNRIWLGTRSLPISCNNVPIPSATISLLLKQASRPSIKASMVTLSAW